jgi:hypothetical protein
MYSKSITRAAPLTRIKLQSLSALLFAFVIGQASQPAAAIDMRELAGEWSLPDTHETLKIRPNGDWYHPKYGRAKIRRSNDSSDIVVFYDGDTKCSYRVSFADAGNTLIIASADSRQDGDRCPTGHFKSVDR